MDVAVIASSEALTAEFERLARYGTLPPSAYTTALGRLREFQVTDEDSDLFAALIRDSQDEYDLDELSAHSWRIAKAVGAEQFGVLVREFELTSERVVHEVTRLLDAGMTAEGIASYRYFSDDTGYGFLSADDILRLRAGGVSGAYCGALCRSRRLAVADVLTLFRAGVPEGYASHLFGRAATVTEVLSFWEDAIPVEYAVFLVADGGDQ